MPRTLCRLVLSVASAVLAVACPAAPAWASGASDPASNRPLSSATETYCEQDPSGSACIDSALADINAAHAAEGVRPMVLPSNFASMTVPEQLLNLANLERVDRGLVPILGLSAALNRDAQTAAEQERDPTPTNFYGDVATGNWAGGYDSPLEASFEWMYDDGPGSANVDCTNADPSGCWGHRQDILWRFTAPIAMGAGVAAGQYGPSVTELFVGGDTRTGPGQPDAPVIEPSQSEGSGPASGNPSGATGHAASNAQPKPTAVITAVVSAGSNIDLTVGCNGRAGARCGLKLTLKVAAKVRGGRLVLIAGPSRARRVTVGAASLTIAAGHAQAVSLSLSPAATRLLDRRHRLRVLLVLDPRSGRPLRRTVTFRV